MVETREPNFITGNFATYIHSAEGELLASKFERAVAEKQIRVAQKEAHEDFLAEGDDAAWRELADELEECAEVKCCPGWKPDC